MFEKPSGSRSGALKNDGSGEPLITGAFED
jgi:hypothetical protein